MPATADAPDTYDLVILGGGSGLGAGLLDGETGDQQRHGGVFQRGELGQQVVELIDEAQDRKSVV